MVLPQLSNIAWSFDYSFSLLVSPPLNSQPPEHPKSKIMNFCESSLFETIGNLSASIFGQPLCDSSSDLMDVQDSYPIF